MKTIKIFLTFIILATFSSFRLKAADVQPTNDKPETVESKAQEYLNPLLQVGESPTDLVTQFGDPTTRHMISSNEVCLSFFFANQNHTAEIAGVGGFDAFIINNRLTYWRPIYQSETMKTSPLEHPFFTSDKEAFGLVVKTDDMNNLVKSLDLKGIANVSDLKTAPDLAFEAKVTIGNDTSQTSTNKTIYLTLNDQDVPKIENLTKNNLGKRILIICRGKVIAAPTIMAPIDSNQFSFPVKNNGFLDHLKE